MEKGHLSLQTVPVSEEEYIPTGHSIISAAYKEFTNHQYRSYMEDGHKIVDCFLEDPNQGYFSIFDGHGGKESVAYCKQHFHEELGRTLTKFPNSVDFAITEAFENIDKQLYNCGHTYVGTTATICLIRNENHQRVLYVANVGDSAAVLVRRDGVEQLTYDHKATDRSEVERVKLHGGSIYKGRLKGSLALTRSLGDHYLKNSGLSYEPSLIKKILTPADELLVLASDGLWDVVKATDLQPYAIMHSKVIASELIQYAVRSGSQDNISVIAINL